jgi:hypothetical protein
MRRYGACRIDNRVPVEHAHAAVRTVEDDLQKSRVFGAKRSSTAGRFAT